MIWKNKVIFLFCQDYTQVSFNSLLKVLSAEGLCSEVLLISSKMSGSTLLSQHISGNLFHTGVLVFSTFGM